MAELIYLLKFAQVGRCEIQPETVDLSGIAAKIAAELRLGVPQRRVVFRIAEGAAAHGDPQLLHLVLENLLGNAWKFTVNREEASIEFGVTEVNEGGLFSAITARL
jgi:signal transduction histidine kinase